MILSTNTSYLAKKFGHKEAIRMISEAGFDAYDMSFFGNNDPEQNHFFADDYIEYAHSVRDFADSLGIKCNQIHSPFGSSTGEPIKDAEIFESIVRSIECASILGAKVAVVHPCQHLKYEIDGNPEILKEINMDFYGRLIPYAEKFKVKIGCENMWQYSDRFKKIVHSTCATPAEFLDYVDSVGSEWLVACLDIGHTVLVGEKNETMIRTLGKNRLKALHVHDVDGHSDLHTLPYLSNIDWESTMGGLREIGYEGDLTFEAGHILIGMPDALLPSTLRFMHDVGRHLISIIEG